MALDPPYFQGHYNRGEVLEAVGRLEEAIESYRRASQLAPWWIDAHAALGLALEAAGRHEEAEAQLSTALSLPLPASGQSGYSAYYKGRVYLVRGDEAAAFSHFEEAARDSPEWAEPLLWLARLHEQRGDRAGAMRVLRQALEREPDCEEAQEGLRALEEETGR